MNVDKFDHLYLVPTCFHHPKRNFVPTKQLLPIFPSAALACTSLLSVFVDLPTLAISFHLNGIMQCMNFGDWLLYLA